MTEAYDYLIVGAGFAGSVLAERLASQAGKRVLVVDRRSHIGGNAHDCYNSDGILIHPYGPHIFHTNSERIFKYLSQFTEWRPYEHRILSSVRDIDGHMRQVPIPINLDSINTLYKLNLTSDELERWFQARAEPVAHCVTSEDVVVSRVGRELYEKFFRGYTRKQWNLDPSQLDASVTARVPVRTNQDDRYFTDIFQAMPKAGYTALFERMLQHAGIEVRLKTDYREIRAAVPFKEIIFTGPIDEFFDYRFGRLPYRSIVFKHETADQEWALPAATVNYPGEDVPYTRITEVKWITGQSHPRTSLMTDYPTDATCTGDPFYPIPRQENTTLYLRYRELADHTQGVHFVGRLASYKYYNMDQVVAQALATFDKLKGAGCQTPFRSDNRLTSERRRVAHK